MNENFENIIKCDVEYIDQSKDILDMIDGDYKKSYALVMPKLQTQPGDPKIVEESARLGAKAFADGKMCIPRHDAEFMQLIAGKQVGESIPYLDAWLKGFTKAVVDEAFVFEIE